MLFVGLQILGEFLESKFNEHFKSIERKSKELGVKLPPFPKPTFVGSTKTLHTMKARPGNKSGDNVLLIQFERAYIKTQSLNSIEFKAYFHFLITTKSFMSLATITDVITQLHGAPINIEEFDNVFTEKGFVKPNVHILFTNIESVTNLNPVERVSDFDVFKFKIVVSFDTRLDWTFNLKL